MQIMIDTATDSPSLLSKFGALLAAMYETVPAPAGEAGTTINGPAEPLELKPEPDFKKSESLPPDNVDSPKWTGPGATIANAVPMIPPPPVTPPAVLVSVPLSTARPETVRDVPPMIPPPPGVPVAGPEFDSKGVQWSAAHHTSTKTKTIDGQWKLRTKRGAKVSDDTTDMGKTSIQGVTIPPAQLPAALAAYVARGTAVPIPPPPVMAPPVVEDDADVNVEDDATTVDFPTFISNITAGMNAGTVTQKQIDEIQTANDLQNLFSLSSAPPELLAKVSAAFGF